MGKMKKEDVIGGKFISERSCTDCCMIPVAFLFLAGWVAIAIVAFINGKPEMLIRPSDVEGNTCGLGKVANATDIFYPQPSQLAVGFCVPTCPNITDFVCNSINTTRTSLVAETPPSMVYNSYYALTASQYAIGIAAISVCSFGVSSVCPASLLDLAERATGLQQRLSTGDCYLVAYPTTVTLYRCLPLISQFVNGASGSGSITISQLQSQFANMTAGQFFMRGFGECRSAWIVIAICVGSACILSLFWVALMRWILAPLVYLSLLLLLAGLVGIGLLARQRALQIEALQKVTDTETNNQLIIWQTIQYLGFIFAGMFALVVLWLLKRIRISIELLKEGGRAFLSTPQMAILPPLVAIALAACIAFFFAMALYIQSMGSFTTSQLSVFTNTQVYQQVANATSISLNVTSYQASVSSRWLHLYNFFGFLWLSNYLIMECIFIISMVTCVWYFSASAQEEAEAKKRLKAVPFGTICRAVYTTFRFHLGTILFGALLIALIQLIRVIALYIEQKLRRHFGDSNTFKMVVCCVNCLLACIEKTVKLISSSSFVVCCVKNTNFCSGCIISLRLIINNILRVGTLASLSVVVTFLIKLCIAVSNTILGWGLLQVPKLLYGTEKIESALFPLFFIFLVTYVIGAIFMSVFEQCVDTVMICFFIDEDEMDGAFMPERLARLVGMYSAVQKAKKEFEDKQKEMNNDPIGEGIPVKK